MSDATRATVQAVLEIVKGMEGRELEALAVAACERKNRKEARLYAILIHLKKCL